MNARRYRILLLECDEYVLMQILRELESISEIVNVTATSDVEEAMQLARSRRHDLMLVGDHPPQVSASEVLRDLQCMRASVPCVVLQTGPGAFVAEDYYSLGASGVVRDWQGIDVWLRERMALRRSRAAGH
jgi:DNA-binding NarL/FixJ family response regulator